MWVVNDSQGCEMQMFHIVLSLLTDESPASKVLFIPHLPWHSKILQSCHRSDHLLFFLFLLDHQSIFAYISSQLPEFAFTSLFHMHIFFLHISKLVIVVIEAGDDGSRSSMPRLLTYVWRGWRFKTKQKFS